MTRQQRDDGRRLGHLVKQLGELKLGSVGDPRRRSGRTWPLTQLLTPTLAGMTAGLFESAWWTRESAPARNAAILHDSNSTHTTDWNGLPDNLLPMLGHLLPRT